MDFEETETLELKRSTSELSDGLKSIVAMLNKHGHGELYFGIRDNGAVVGQQIGKDTLRDISKSIADHIEPGIYPKIEKTIIEGKSCIRVSFHGDDALYYVRGRAYERVNDEDRLLTPKEIENRVVKKHTEQLRWDTQSSTGAILADIDEEKVQVFTEWAKLPYKSKDNTLEKLGLLTDGNLLNTAVLLFAEHPEKFLVNAKLRCAVFGTTTTAYIIDRQEFTGDLFSLIARAEKYVLENIHIGMKVEGMYREDIPEINREAIREAIINAFCHRDYREYDSVSIAIFRDRIEIRSPGGLFGGLTIEQITSNMISKRRNEVLAEMLHRVHYVEKWGRGIELMLSKEPDATFKEVANIFVTTFRRKDESGRPIAPDREEESGLVDGLVEKWVEGLVETQQRIIILIRENPRISKKEMAERIGISTTAIDKNIERLKELKLLKRVGAAKGGHWEVLMG
jgi:ATP-dependent DNA helicase RecG